MGMSMGAGVQKNSAYMSGFEHGMKDAKIALGHRYLDKHVGHTEDFINGYSIDIRAQEQTRRRKGTYRDK